MIDKKVYLDKLIEMNAIFKKYDFLAPNEKECSQIKNTIDDFAFRVVLIGGFSSGKSAFLNRLIGRPIFKEDLGPETALPAEVSWAPVDRCEAFFEDGRCSDLPIESATANVPQGTSYLSIHLDNQFLKQRPELILVDFPGFDSNVQAHNRAINAYLKKGSAFLLFVPAQNGALTSSDIKFLKEAASYPQTLGCFISKADVRPLDKCEEIVNYIRSGIAMYYGEEVPTTLISIMPDCISDFEDRVASMVDRFNPQTLFNLSLAPIINEQLNTAINALEEYMQATQLDTNDLENKIIANEEMIEALNSQLEKERAKLNRKYELVIIPDIMSRLENAYHANIDALVEAAMAGGQRFGDVAQSIARPILANVPGEIQANLRDVIRKMPMENKAGTPEDHSVRDILLNIIDVVSTFIPTSQGKVLPQSRPKMDNPGAPLSGTALTGMGTGLIVGVMGNPVLGVLIALAPALVNVFFGARKQPQGATLAQQARVQMESEGIPAIMQRLESAITPAIMQTRDVIFKEIEQKIRENQQAAAQAMEQAKNEKQNRFQDHAQIQAQIQADIKCLQGLRI